jgi:molybdopterin biosynthesis enzyme
VSGYVILSLFGPAALAVLSGQEADMPWRRPGRTTTAMRSGPRERFIPVRLCAPAEGDPLPRLGPTATTGSGDWSSLAAFDALAYLPPRAELAPGDDVGYYPLLLRP